MRIETLLTRLFVVVYAVACFTLIFMENSNNCCNVDKNYWFSEQMVSDSKNVQDAECVWLVQTQDETKYCVAEGFTEDEHIKIDGETLEKIIDPHFYIEQNENMALGLFFPLAMVSYHVNDTEIKIVYSFVNAEARVFENGEFVKAVALYDANVLNDLLENL